MRDAKFAILFVDDDKEVLKALKAQVRKNFGTELIYETAQSAEEAFTIIREIDSKNIALVIIVSDWLMPGIRGDEFLIKVHQMYPHISAIMLTGQATPEAIERASREGHIMKCLHKPWDEHELINLIKTGFQLHEEIKGKKEQGAP